MHFLHYRIEKALDILTRKFPKPCRMILGIMEPLNIFSSKYPNIHPPRDVVINSRIYVIIPAPGNNKTCTSPKQIACAILPILTPNIAINRFPINPRNNNSSQTPLRNYRPFFGFAKRIYQFIGIRNDRLIKFQVI